MSNRKLAIECLKHAAHSRQMWMHWRAKDPSHVCWDFYRGWLLDAREARLGLPFKGHGCRGVPAGQGVTFDGNTNRNN